MVLFNNKKNLKVINNVENLIKTESKNPKSPETANLLKLTKSLYELAGTDELNKCDSYEDLLAIVKNLYSFIKDRNPEKDKVKVYNPTAEENGWESKYTIVELTIKDSPFLVDSVIEKLLQYGLSIEIFFHPIISVSRSKNVIQNLEFATSKNDNKSDFTNESVMHIQVTKIWDNQLITEIQQSLKEVLQTVFCVVNDWETITNKIPTVVTNLTESIFYLTKQYNATKKKNLVEEGDEIKNFLNWLLNNNFIFLGYAETKIKKDKAEILEDTTLGLFKEEKNFISEDLNIPVASNASNANSEVIFCCKEGKHLANITKTSNKSIVHRTIHMDYISINIIDKEGHLSGVHNFVGMFTSTVYYKNVVEIPIIRKKIEAVRKSADVPLTGHFSKAMSAVFANFPRDELFQMSIKQLLDIVLHIITLEINPQLKFFVREDFANRFISTLVFMPKEYLNTGLRKNIQRLLEKEFQGTVSNLYTQVTDSHLARIQIIIKTNNNNKIKNYNTEKIEKELQEMAYPWEEKLTREIKEKIGDKDLKTLLHNYNYKNAFSANYQSNFSAEEAYMDISYLASAIKKQGIIFNLHINQAEKNSEILNLKIYNYQEKLPLSVFIPILENIGFIVIDEHTYLITPGDDKKNSKVWLHSFRLSVPGINKSNIGKIKHICEEALTQIWNGHVDNDKYNKLIILSKMQWRHTVLIRAYSKYFKQAGFSYSQEYIQNALTEHPIISKDIIRLFHLKFIPNIKLLREFIEEDGKFSKKLSDGVKKAKLIGEAEELLKEEYKSIEHNIQRKLYLISNAAEDKVIRVFLEVLAATIRTNFFQADEKNNYKSYISLKFDCKKISILPAPKPYKEIFVYSTKVEGIHLRGGKVARGGLRWSDRHEDFRTEILGLMKAQMTKNTVIIPVGSKGGFVVKRNIKDLSREEISKEGIECYKTLLRGLLDITDNISGDKIVKPRNTKCYDEDDPYLVVAADKGTATFSDIANSISKEYGFWLGDAFASGGSVGYDHKKMGITAKGAWISVQRHFYELGINIEKESFTAVGIGDMAGDVFGNGMLLSKNIKLIGAFNHLHIFLDPNPDPKVSYNERKRLFNLPRSGWKDYNVKLLSKGGGIYERSAKTIKLSKEIQKIIFKDDPKALAIYNKTNSITPDNLIKKLLLSPVDLLWNGGIGTYIKSRFESNEDAEDKSNDALRVNGCDLKAKVVGEGGNLGCTQLGRIEYARKGGQINTDFIDNSAGVDCSDHEVNIKIVFEKLIREKQLDFAKRDKILEEMTEEIGKLVLTDNWFQTEALCISENQGLSVLEDQERLIKYLEKKELLDRKIEFLPEDEEIRRLQSEGLSFSRPELCTLISYSKIALYEDLLKSNLSKEEYYNEDLLMYFPELMREKFKKDILNHQLRHEIISTIITNCAINRMGMSAFYHIKEDTGLDSDVIARAYVISRDIFNIKEIWDDIKNIKSSVSVEIQTEMFTDVQTLLERSTLWFLKNYKSELNISDLTTKYKKGIEELYVNITSILPPVLTTTYKEKLARYQHAGVNESLAKKCALLYGMLSACDILYISKDKDTNLNIAGAIYFKIGARLQLGILRRHLENMKTSNYWERLSAKTLIYQLYELQRNITTNVIESFCTKDFCIASADEWKGKNRPLLEKYDYFLQDLKLSEYISVSKVMIVAKKIREIFL